MKNYCKNIGIEKINTNNHYMEFIYSKEASNKTDGTVLFMESNNFNDIKLSYKDNKIFVILNVGRKDKLDCFKQMCSFFDRISV